MNVLDKYKFWSQEGIRLDVSRNTFPYYILMQNLDHDFNISGIIRNANALGAKKVYHLCDQKKFDRRGAVGCQNYTDIEHLCSIEKFMAIKSQFSRIIAIDCNRDFVRGKMKSLYDVKEFPKDCLFIIGSECSGISEELLNLCDEMIYIPMYGSVRSFNAACASAVIMNSVAQYFSSISK